MTAKLRWHALAERLYLPSIVALAIGLAVASCPLGRAFAAGPWYVAPSGSDGYDCMSPATPCGTINGAIAKAASGDTVYVAVGVYTNGSADEVVLIDRSVTLSGGWDAGFSTQVGKSTIDARGARRGIHVVLTWSEDLTIAIDNFILQNGYIGGGAGIVNNRATLTVLNSIITNNTAVGASGGGLINDWGGTVTLVNTTVSSNTASSGGGGGILNGSGSLFLYRSIVTDNIASEVGGGISSPGGGPVFLSETSILSNAAYSGGGVFSYGDVTFDRSTVSGNSATGTDGDGGGLDVFANLTLKNSTISGNSAGRDGGGIYHGQGDMVLGNSTVTGNIAGASGGGIFHGAHNATLQNSLIAKNVASSGPDCSDWAAFVSGGYNLIGDTSSCLFISTTSDRLNIDAFLGPLQDNDGPTLTHALLSGSPAIDAANPDSPGSGGYACEASDQRGVARPQGPRCDIGAFELEAAPALEITIDIKPKSFPNIIKANRPGNIPVAILTTESFDATTVDPLSVAFGPNGAHEVHNKGHVEDADGDGDLDMVLHFAVRASGIALGDAEACLIGHTMDGVPIEGCDSIVTIAS